MNTTNIPVGQLHVIIGPMFSGKTTELIKRLRRYSAIGKNVLVINSSKDTRNENNVIMTHTKETLDAIKTEFLTKTSEKNTINFLNIQKPRMAYHHNVIGIDEAQFFEDLIPFVKQKVNDGFIVVVAGLIGDFEQKPFGHILELLPLCDTITHLKSYCTVSKDGTLAPFTKRIVDSKEQELVGADDMYTAVCRKYL
jgi:thymidine kinase